MLHSIRRWLAVHPQWAITFLVSAMLGPFLAKPFNLDDPLFIWLARQVQIHPGNPFAFAVNWYGQVGPMWAVTENPPVAGYYFALAGNIFGWNEIGLHLAGLAAAIGVLLGTHRLARHLCRQPMVAVCATLFAPIFLVSANTVMCDMLMLAFWVWAMVFWLEGLSQNHSGKLLAAGLLMALALLTKYFGVALLPLLAVHGALEKRKAGFWVAAWMIPLAALGAYQWITFALYGHALFSAAASFATSVQGELGFTRLADALIALAFTGGGAAGVLFLAPLLWRARVLAILALGTLFLGVAVLLGGHLLHKYPALATPWVRGEVSLQLIFWALGGVLVLAMARAEMGQNRRDSRAWLLALWVAGTFIFTAFANWTINGRSLLPMLPAVGILLARRWDVGGRRSPRALHWGLAMSALLALLVAQSDYQLAVAVRRSAQAVFVRCAQSRQTIWFEGHWGFQYYLEQWGAAPVDFKHSRQLPGDILVVPQHNTDVAMPAPEIVGHRDMLSVSCPSGCATWQGAVGAGFYSSVVGPLPFAFGRVPPENVLIFELQAAAAK
jgi:4-amino-4-deoxy-L-arabinose transferase-like glycosyltransferase